MVEFKSQIPLPTRRDSIYNNSVISTWIETGRGPNSNSRNRETLSPFAIARNNPPSSTITPSRIPVALRFPKWTYLIFPNGPDKKTISMLHQTSEIFKPTFRQGPIDQESIRPQGENSIYNDQILQHELKKEDDYHQEFSAEQGLQNLNAALRGRVVDWIFEAASFFRYSVDTVHLAVCIMDAYITKQRIKPHCWELLGLTAFQLAGKMEENNRKNLPTVWKKYEALKKFHKRDVYWLEMHILKALKFSMMMPTAIVFADLAFDSRKINFPSERIEKVTKRVAYIVLEKSLHRYDFKFIKYSCEAELAIQIATAYIMANFGNFAQFRRFTEEDAITLGNRCYEIFRKILLDTAHPYFSPSPDQLNRRGV